MRSCCAGHHSEACLRLHRVGSRWWWTLYHLIFVLDVIHSLFRLVGLKCVFMLQIKQSCESERLVLFCWCRPDQMWTGGTEIYMVWRFGEIRARKCALTGAFLMPWSYYVSFAPTSRVESEWDGVYHLFRGVVSGCGKMNFVVYHGDIIFKWCEIIIFSGKCISVYLLTDRN